MLKFDTDDFFLFNSEEINDLTKKSSSARSAEEEALKRLFSSVVNFPSGGKNNKFVLPQGPKRDARWVSHSDIVYVGDFKISCGFFYFGTYLPSRYSDLEPSLINPNLELDASPHIFEKTYLPKSMEYSNLSPSERYSYLMWLYEDRPVVEDTPEWYLRVFLMGIERRVTLDNECGLVKLEEMSALKNELFRILNLLSYKAAVIRRLYAGMLQLISLNTKDKPIYSQSINISFFAFKELQIYVNIGLAECAKYNVPLTAELAFAYYECDKAFKLPLAAKCCNAEFKNIFVYLYNKKYPNGIKMSRPHSAGFSGFYFTPSSPALCPNIQFKLQETLPTVAFTDSLINKINNIAKDCIEIIAAYAKHFNSNTKPFVFLLLPETFFTKRTLTLDDITGSNEAQKFFLKTIGAAKDFNVKHKKAIVQFLINDVFFCNVTSFEAISLLEKVYTNLGFDKNDLYGNLHNLSQKSCGHQSKKTEIKIELDSRKIKKLREDSDQVCNLLSDIFCEEIDATLEHETAAETDVSPLLLDKKHGAFLLELIKKDTWKKTDLQKCAKGHSLMIDGAIEIINEASFNVYNEALIEEDDESGCLAYHCNKKIAKKIKAETAA